MSRSPWRTLAIAIIPGLLVTMGMCSVPTWRDAAWTCMSSVSFAQESGPRLALAKTRFDFGQVRAGRRLEALVTIQNDGNRRLIVHEAGEHCNCTAQDAAALIVEPGQSAELVAQFDARAVTGQQQLALSYTTNDPQQPRFEIVLRATIIPND